MSVNSLFRLVPVYGSLLFVESIVIGAVALLGDRVLLTACPMAHDVAHLMPDASIAVMSVLSLGASAAAFSASASRRFNSATMSAVEAV